jgi:hypothetical protein
MQCVMCTKEMIKVSGRMAILADFMKIWKGTDW